MTIKTLIDTAGALSVADGSFIADGPTKASCIFNLNLIEGVATPIIETVESENEKNSAGLNRLMAKSTLRIPRTAFDTLAQTRVLASGESDTIPIHMVMALPKTISQILASASVSDAYLQKTLLGLIVKAVSDCVAVMFKGTTVVVPRTTTALLATAALAQTGPIRRAVMGLQPLDTSDGVYGAAAEA